MAATRCFQLVTLAKVLLPFSQARRPPGEATTTDMQPFGQLATLLGRLECIQLMVEKSSWNCSALALRFDWFNADDAVERTANGIEIGYGSRAAPSAAAERTGTGMGTGTTRGCFLAWRARSVAVARCQIWLRSVFQQQQLQQHQIELIVKEKLAKTLACCCTRGIGKGWASGLAAAAARINFASKVAFTFCGHPFYIYR